MEKKVCCFASNKNLIDVEKLKPNLKSEIKKLIIDFSASKFYVCLESNFDRLCVKCLKEIKYEYPNIRLCLVLTDSLKIRTNNLFNEIIYLNFEKITKQFIRLSTFNWLIGNSDYLISVKEENGKQAPEVVIRDLSNKDLLFFTVRLKMLRIKSGLSQVKLAKVVNVSPYAISMYEQGLREPDFLTFLDICVALNSTPNYILGLDRKFKSKLIEIDELLCEFIKTIMRTRGLLYKGDLVDKTTRKNLVASLAMAFEVTKNLQKKENIINKYCHFLKEN